MAKKRRTVERPSRQLPDHYRQASTSDPTQGTSGRVLAGLAFVVLFVVMFAVNWVADRVGPEAQLAGFVYWTALLATVAGTYLLHESLHVVVARWLLGKWMTVRRRGVGTLYVDMSGWFIPRNQYVVIVMTPFVVLTGIGVALLWVVPWSVLLAAALGVNSASSLADVVGSASLMRKPRDAVVENRGTASTVHVPS